MESPSANLTTVNNLTDRSPRAFGKKDKGGNFCCVPVCHNSSVKDKRIDIERSYYRFPKQGTKQFNLWIEAIRRENWQWASWNRICSDHFKEGKKGHTASHPGYVPSIFPWHKNATPRVIRTSSGPVVAPLREPQRSSNSKLTTMKIKAESESSTRNAKRRRLNYSDPTVNVTTPQPTNHDYLTTEVEDCDSIQMYLTEIQEKVNHLEKQAEMADTYKAQILDLNQIKDNLKQIQFWTGFPNYDTMFALFQFLELRVINMKYWRGSSTTSSEHFSKRFVNKPGPERKLSLLDEFFLTMVRLRVGLLTEDLSQRFWLSLGSISSIITSWVNLMYTDLKLICELPSRDVTSTNQSLAIGSYTDVQVILDCTELFVQNPSKLDARKQFFPNYKHHITYKFLVGISPQMGVTFVSRMYGGRASDKFITSDSDNLLLNLNKGKGSVMTDRGFLVEGILSDMGVKLHMPSFKRRDRSQLSASEGSISENISSVRIHIERAIQRIKIYHILDGELKLSMKEVAEQVFTVCAYLVNFQAPIVMS